MNLLCMFSGPGPRPDLDSMPSPPPIGCCGAPQPGPAPLWYQESLPLIILAVVLVAMLISGLNAYSPRFREFWSDRVCGFMERHGKKEQP